MTISGYPNRYLTDEERAERRRKVARRRKIDKALGWLLASLTALVGVIMGVAIIVFIVSVSVGVARWAF